MLAPIVDWENVEALLGSKSKQKIRKLKKSFEKVQRQKKLNKLELEAELEYGRDTGRGALWAESTFEQMRACDIFQLRTRPSKQPASMITVSHVQNNGFNFSTVGESGNVGSGGMEGVMREISTRQSHSLGEIGSNHIRPGSNHNSLESKQSGVDVTTQISGIHGLINNVDQIRVGSFKNVLGLKPTDCSVERNIVTAPGAIDSTKAKPLVASSGSVNLLNNIGGASGSTASIGTERGGSGFLNLKAGSNTMSLQGVDPLSDALTANIANSLQNNDLSPMRNQIRLPNLRKEITCAGLSMSPRESSPFKHFCHRDEEVAKAWNSHHHLYEKEAVAGLTAATYDVPQMKELNVSVVGAARLLKRRPRPLNTKSTIYHTDDNYHMTPAGERAKAYQDHLDSLPRRRDLESRGWSRQTRRKLAPTTPGHSPSRRTDGRSGGQGFGDISREEGRSGSDCPTTQINSSSAPTTRPGTRGADGHSFGDATRPGTAAESGPDGNRPRTTGTGDVETRPGTTVPSCEAPVPSGGINVDDWGFQKDFDTTQSGATHTGAMSGGTHGGTVSETTHGGTQTMSSKPPTARNQPRSKMELSFHNDTFPNSGSNSCVRERPGTSTWTATRPGTSSTARPGTRDRSDSRGSERSFSPSRIVRRPQPLPFIPFEGRITQEELDFLAEKFVDERGPDSFLNENITKRFEPRVYIPTIKERQRMKKNLALSTKKNLELSKKQWTDDDIDEEGEEDRDAKDKRDTLDASNSIELHSSRDGVGETYTGSRESNSTGGPHSRETPLPKKSTDSAVGKGPPDGRADIHATGGDKGGTHSCETKLSRVNTADIQRVETWQSRDYPNDHPDNEVDYMGESSLPLASRGESVVNRADNSIASCSNDGMIPRVHSGMPKTNSGMTIPKTTNGILKNTSPKSGASHKPGTANGAFKPGVGETGTVGKYDSQIGKQDTILDTNDVDSSYPGTLIPLSEQPSLLSDVTLRIQATASVQEKICADTDSLIKDGVTTLQGNNLDSAFKDVSTILNESQDRLKDVLTCQTYLEELHYHGGTPFHGTPFGSPFRSPFASPPKTADRLSPGGGRAPALNRANTVPDSSSSVGLLDGNYPLPDAPVHGGGISPSAKKLAEETMPSLPGSLSSPRVAGQCGASSSTALSASKKKSPEEKDLSASGKKAKFLREVSFEESVNLGSSSRPGTASSAAKGGRKGVELAVSKVPTVGDSMDVTGAMIKKGLAMASNGSLETSDEFRVGDDDIIDANICSSTYVHGDPMTRTYEFAKSREYSLEYPTPENLQSIIYRNLEARVGATETKKARGMEQYADGTVGNGVLGGRMGDIPVLRKRENDQPKPSDLVGKMKQPAQVGKSTSTRLDIDEHGLGDKGLVDKGLVHNTGGGTVLMTVDGRTHRFGVPISKQFFVPVSYADCEKSMHDAVGRALNLNLGLHKSANLGHSSLGQSSTLGHSSLGQSSSASISMGSRTAGVSPVSTRGPHDIDIDAKEAERDQVDKEKARKKEEKERARRRKKGEEKQITPSLQRTIDHEKRVAERAVSEETPRVGLLAAMRDAFGFDDLGNDLGPARFHANHTVMGTRGNQLFGTGQELQQRSIPAEEKFFSRGESRLSQGAPASYEGFLEECTNKKDPAQQDIAIEKTGQDSQRTADDGLDHTHDSDKVNAHGVEDADLSIRMSVEKDPSMGMDQIKNEDHDDNHIDRLRRPSEIGDTDGVDGVGISGLDGTRLDATGAVKPTIEPNQNATGVLKPTIEQNQNAKHITTNVGEACGVLDVLVDHDPGVASPSSGEKKNLHGGANSTLTFNAIPEGSNRENGKTGSPKSSPTSPLDSPASGEKIKDRLSVKDQCGSVDQHGSVVSSAFRASTRQSTMRKVSRQSLAHGLGGGSIERGISRKSPAGLERKSLAGGGKGMQSGMRKSIFTLDSDATITPLSRDEKNAMISMAESFGKRVSSGDARSSPAIRASRGGRISGGIRISATSTDGTAAGVLGQSLDSGAPVPGLHYSGGLPKAASTPGLVLDMHDSDLRGDRSNAKAAKAAAALQEASGGRRGKLLEPKETSPATLKRYIRDHIRKKIKPVNMISDPSQGFMLGADEKEREMLEYLSFPLFKKAPDTMELEMEIERELFVERAWKKGFDLPISQDPVVELLYGGYENYMKLNFGTES